MKKLLSVFLALALVMSLGFTALAAEAPKGTYEKGTLDTGLIANTPSTVTFPVSYRTDREANTENLGQGAYPTEPLTFTATAASKPEGVQDGDISVSPVTVGANPTVVTVNIPKYSTVGKYVYQIQQQAGNTPGVDYDESIIKLEVVVTYDQEGALQKQVTFSASNPEGKKINSLINTYTVTDGSGTTLSVAKEVLGNMGDRNQVFDVTVTLTKPGESKIYTKIVVDNGERTEYSPEAWVGNSLEIQLKIKDSQNIFINGIPTGITATVKEAEAHTNPVSSAEDKNNPAKGYTAAYWVNEKSVTSAADLAITAEQKQAVKITNTKTLSGQDVEPQTGVNLDALPYIILLAVAAAVLVIFLVKRRAGKEY